GTSGDSPWTVPGRGTGACGRRTRAAQRLRCEPSMNERDHKPEQQALAAARGEATPLAPTVTAHGLPRSLLQRKLLQRRARAAKKTDAAQVQAAAESGIAGAAGPLPHLDAIQRSFGRHDVSHVHAHTDETAGQAARAMGAEAYATGNNVAFAGAPSLHT